jgi:uncharacterized membrane protein
MDTTTHREPADRAQARRDALALAVSGPLVTAVLLAVWAATGAGHFWPMWPLLGMSIAMLVALWRAFGPAYQAAAGSEPRPRPR